MSRDEKLQDHESASPDRTVPPAQDAASSQRTGSAAAAASVSAAAAEPAPAASTSAAPAQAQSAAPAAAASAPATMTAGQRIMRLIKLNILFISISLGLSTYFIFHYVSFLQPIKYPIKHFFDGLVPYLIFTLLFLAFSKVELRRMKPRRWHLVLITFQIGVPFLTALLMVYWPEGEAKYRLELEGIIVCVITPTAAAAAVITGKLGGDESSLTTYTLLSNLGAAVGIPLIFPLISANAQNGFFQEFMIIMNRVFPLIVLPLILAQGIRYLVKPLNTFICTRLREFNFYLWAFTLSTISATAISNMMNSGQSSETLTNLALVGLVFTAIQFAFGKLTGHLEGQRITAGQALGQKNMVIGIWITLAYLTPAASIAPGCYILWQNVVNSWQLYWRESRKLTYTDKM